MTIYEMTEEWLQLKEAGLSGLYDPQIIEDMQKDLETDLEKKAESYKKIDLELEAQETALDKEIARLTEMKSAITKNRESIKSTLLKVMTATNKREFTTQLFSFKIKKNPPSVIVTAKVDELPLEYLVPQDPKVNKKMIGEQLKAGKKLDFAHLEQGESLIIK